MGKMPTEQIPHPVCPPREYFQHHFYEKFFEKESQCGITPNTGDDKGNLKLTGLVTTIHLTTAVYLNT